MTKGGLLAWRGWIYYQGRLYGMVDVDLQRPWQRGLNVARCVHFPGEIVGDTVPCSDAPGWVCGSKVGSGCGFYGFTTPCGLYGVCLVSGVMRYWGRVIEHEAGVRAQYVMVERLWVYRDTLNLPYYANPEVLADYYDCDVITVADLNETVYGINAYMGFTREAVA